MELTSGQARYLLAVYHLGLGARGVRCADIARMLDVTRPSVVKMLSFFSQRCLIARERYGKVGVFPVFDFLHYDFFPVLPVVFVWTG